MRTWGFIEREILTIYRKRRNDNKNETSVSERGGPGCQRGQLSQNAVFLGKRHNNKILKDKFYCRETLWSLRRLVVFSQKEKERENKSSLFSGDPALFLYQCWNRLEDKVDDLHARKRSTNSSFGSGYLRVGLPREAVAAKNSVCSSKPRENKLIGSGYTGIVWDIQVSVQFLVPGFAIRIANRTSQTIWKARRCDSSAIDWENAQKSIFLLWLTWPMRMWQDLRCWCAFPQAKSGWKRARIGEGNRRLVFMSSVAGGGCTSDRDFLAQLAQYGTQYVFLYQAIVKPKQSARRTLWFVPLERKKTLWAANRKEKTVPLVHQLHVIYSVHLYVLV